MYKILILVNILCVFIFFVYFKAIELINYIDTLLDVKSLVFLGCLKYKFLFCLIFIRHLILNTNRMSSNTSDDFEDSKYNLEGQFILNVFKESFFFTYDCNISMDLVFLHLFISLLNYVNLQMAIYIPGSQRTMLYSHIPNGYK
jgi:hypothetical protein